MDIAFITCLSWRALQEGNCKDQRELNQVGTPRTPLSATIEVIEYCLLNSDVVLNRIQTCSRQKAGEKTINADCSDHSVPTPAKHIQ
jgi:hypothetical protein